MFASGEPVKLSFFETVAGLEKVDAEIIMESLRDEYRERSGGIVLREIAGGYILTTHEQYGARLNEVFRERKRETLSRASLESLAIIAYKQPITIPEIDEIRGAGSRAAVFQLLRKSLIKGYGKKEVPGHPTLYVTTAEFLRHFAINSLADLPALQEIKNLQFEDLEAVR